MFSKEISLPSERLMVPLASSLRSREFAV